MKKESKSLTVKELDKIMRKMDKSMKTDARVLVRLRGREYVITRVGQFQVIRNLTFDIELNKSGYNCVSNGIYHFSFSA